MRYHFKLDGLDSDHAHQLLSIESAMTDGHTRTAVFNLKNLSVYMDRDPEKARSYISDQLGAFHMRALEALLSVVGLDLLDLYKTVRRVMVVLKSRPSA